MPGLEWLKEVEWHDLLTADAQMVLDSCGEDFLIKFYEELASITLYLSMRPIDEAKKRYMKKYCGDFTVKQLAQRLGCSERWVYEVLAGAERDNSKGGSQ